MSERADLYRAVLDAPDDDAPRLVYADWLDEHGEPERAEFIRVQCAAARIPAQTARWRPLDDRAERLYREWRSRWAGPTLEHALSADFQRGCVDRVALTIDQFLASADELLDREPVRVWEFKAVAFFLRSPSFPRLANHPAFGRVRGLAIGQFAPDELVRAVAESPHLGRLRSLAVTYHLPGAEAIAALFDAAPHLGHLEAVDAPVSNFHKLWRRGAVARLRRLSLVHCRVSDHVVEQMSSSPAMRNLESLRLDLNDVSERGAAALANSEFVHELRELSLAETSLGDRGVIALARSPVVRDLKVLNLANCHVDNSGAQALADSPYLNELECLCLDGNRIGVEVERELEKRFGPGVCSFSWP
ncbi:MAG TPA: TIGR02996 domain-containing protein [Gemmataceae bacterium]|nr:TIGR02996 domain-containing protein [Gemmataceae bacterium]